VDELEPTTEKLISLQDAPGSSWSHIMGRAASVMRAAAGRALSYFDMFSEILPSEAILKAAICVYFWSFPSGNVVLQDAVLHVVNEPRFGDSPYAEHSCRMHARNMAAFIYLEKIS
jgi:hypothetical protein